MITIQIIINIPEDRYNQLMSERDLPFRLDMEGYITDGTPLPKGHGDLVDRNAIEVLRIGNTKREYDKGFDAGVSCMVNRILEAPTIIEADNEE